MLTKTEKALVERVRTEIAACFNCGGSGRHAPIIARPALPDRERWAFESSLPDSVECSQCKPARSLLTRLNPDNQGEEENDAR